MRPLTALSCGVILLALAGCQGDRSADDDALVVYSSRNDHLIKPIVDRFSAETGVAVRYLTDQDGALLARLEAEGARSPADVLLTVDAGNLWRAADLGLLQPMESALLRERIPASYRDGDMHWVGLSLRARTIVYSTERVTPDSLSTYAALTDPKWRGRLCLRTSKKVYNQSLVATMISRLGEEEAERVVRGWVDNLATEPFANDSSVVEAIAAGRCDVGIVNTYYFGRLQQQNPELPVALFWANQDDGESGVHINVSGAGVTRASQRPERAQAFIEWLSEPGTQQQFAELNLEFPAVADAELAPLVEAWGTFRGDTLPVGEAGRLQARAVRLMDRAGYR